eukprot:3961548-Pyramimonas_sp.AAC.1
MSFECSTASCGSPAAGGVEVQPRRGLHRAEGIAFIVAAMLTFYFVAMCGWQRLDLSAVGVADS